MMLMMTELLARYRAILQNAIDDEQSGLSGEPMPPESIDQMRSDVHACDEVLGEFARVGPNAAPGVNADDPPSREWIPMKREGPGANEGEWFRNPYYDVLRVELSRGVVKLMIANADNSARRDWREFQQIKNELAGSKWWGYEAFPPETDVVDPSNKFYLWCFSMHMLPDDCRLMAAEGRRVKDAGPSSMAPQRALPPREKRAAGEWPHLQFFTIEHGDARWDVTAVSLEAAVAMVRQDAMFDEVQFFEGPLEITDLQHGDHDRAVTMKIGDDSEEGPVTSDRKVMLCQFKVYADGGILLWHHPDLDSEDGDPFTQDDIDIEIGDDDGSGDKGDSQH